MLIPFYFLILAGIVAVAAATNCPSGSTPSSSNPDECHYFGIDKMPYLNAEQECLTLGGHLFIPKTFQEAVVLSREARAIFNGTGSSDFWFGANHINGNWEWIDGSYRKIENWNKLQSTSQPYTICGALALSEAKLNGENCFDFKPYVCVFVVNEEETTTISSTESTPTSSSTESTSTSSSTESTTTSSSTETTPTSSSTESSSTSSSTETTPTTAFTDLPPSTSSSTESTSTSSSTKQPTTPTASTPLPTVTSSCSGAAKTTLFGCSDECEQSCGERLIERAQRVCSTTFSFRKKHAWPYCDDQTLYRMCCLKECSDCDIKACRCPEFSKHELETK